MGVIVKKIAIEDFNDKTKLYSKQIKGNLDFTIESHLLDNGRKMQLYFYRKHERVQEFIEKGVDLQLITKQETHLKDIAHVLRFFINDEEFMVDNPGTVSIDIIEYNFNTKQVSLSDFNKGKVAVLIDFTFNEEANNSKLKTEIKALSQEE